jgi:hypothetical protein
MTEDKPKRKPHSGQFKKGQPSANPKGRPKKKPVPDVDNTQFKDNPKKALLYLLNNATTEQDVFKYAKALIDYCEPKLSSIQSQVKQEKTVTIQIEGFQPLEIEQAGGKVIEGEVVEDDVLTKDSLEQLKKDKLKEVKK